MKSRLSPVRPGRNRHRQGFALIATLSMMILLTLIAVGLLTLSTVTVRSSAGENAQRIARANARLALQLALAELQRCAGPDQRVTAAADMAGSSDGSRLASGGTPANTESLPAPDSSRGKIGNGLVAPQAGTRQWVGVWGNRDVADDLYKQTPAPVLLNWLVSGNETAASFDADTDTGRITSESVAAPFAPNLTTNLGLSTTAQSTDLTIGGKPGVLLAGANTVVDPAASPATADLDRYVVAPALEVRDAAGQTTGRYAYWVGDEGIKAKFNSVDPNAAKTDALNDPIARARIMAVQHTGIEAVTGLGDYPAPSKGQTKHSALQKVATYGSAQFPESLSKRLLNPRFHDFTAHSSGVLSDSRSGGLRKDLSYLLAQTSLPASMAGTGLLPDAYSPLAVPGDTTSKVPKWDLLHSFYQLAPEAATGSVEVRPQTKTQMGISPVISMARLMAGYLYEPSFGQRGRYFASPLIQLSNPYPVTLTSSTDLELKFEFGRRLRHDNGLENVPSAADVIGRIQTGRRFQGPGNQTFAVFRLFMTNEGGMFNNCRLTIPDFSLAPGVSKLYRIKGKVQRTVFGGGSANEKVIELEETTPEQVASDYTYMYQEDWVAQPWQEGGFRLQESWQSSPVGLEMSTAKLRAEAVSQGKEEDKLQVLSTFNFELEAYDVNETKNSQYYQSQGETASAAGKFAGIFVVYSGFYGFPGNGGLPSGGNRAIRSYADFNPRASFFGTLNPFQTVWSPRADNSDARADVVPGSFSKYLSDENAWAYSLVSPTVSRAVLFDLPRASGGSSTVPVLSLGQLQHVNVTAADGVRDVGTRATANPIVYHHNVGVQPAFVIGNSYAHPFLNRQKTRQEAEGDRRDFTKWPNWFAPRTDYDISYLLNSRLWDQYFFSSVPQTGSLTPANARMTALSSTAADLRDADKAAANVMVDGAFNVNSTSVEAWTALLAGMRGLPKLPNSTGDNSQSAIFPRGIWQPGDSQSQLAGDNDASYSGYRGLTDAQVRTLAEEIVKQVRLRGPFVSLGQFVNRALVSVAADGNGLGISGALQAAIDRSGTNSLSGGSLTDSGDRSHYNDWGTIPADGPVNAVGQRSSNIPGWLSQADILQAVGPVIAARSDTFVIRAYGDAKNPLTGEITARAWCEATVQRMPEFYDSSQPSWTAPASLNGTNKLFGRRFHCISFRWLTPTEI